MADRIEAEGIAAESVTADRIAVGRVCALVLAGGRSARMGTDKTLLPIGDGTMLERAVAFWRSCDFIENVLVAVGTQTHFDCLPEGAIPVFDLYPGCGPMAGLHAAFAQTDADVLFVSAVDMPFLRRDALPPMPVGDAAVCVKDGVPEPLLGAYRRTALPAIERCLARGDRKMRRLLDCIDTEYAALPPEAASAAGNLNTRGDYLRALAGTPPMLVCMGWSGSGKTTFLEKLIPALCRRGVRVAAVKHDAHGFQMDTPGKDTYRLAAAGAVCTAISGPNGWAVLARERIDLDGLRQKLPDADIILTEGHKYAPLPKLEIHRRETGKPFIVHDATLLAAITDEPVDTDAPQLGLDDVEPCAALIMETLLPDWEERHGDG